MRECRACEQGKPLSEFYTHIRYGKTQYSTYCKPCHNQRTVLNTRARKYGLSVDEMTSLLDTAESCEICGRDIARDAVNFDHDHQSGTLRGMLCRDCNLLLGHARDEVSTLEAAIRYLHHYSSSG